MLTEDIYGDVGLLVPRVGLQVDAYSLNDFGGSGHVADDTSTHISTLLRTFFNSPDPDGLCNSTLSASQTITCWTDSFLL